MPRACAALLTVLAGAVVTAAADTLPVEYFTRPSDLDRMQIAPDGKFLAATYSVDGSSRLAFIELARPEPVTEIVAPAGAIFHDFQWVSPVRVLYRLAVQQPGLQRVVTTGDLLAIDRDGSKPQYVYGCRYVNGGRESGLELSKRLSQPQVPEGDAAAEGAAAAPAGDAAAGLRMSCGTAEVLSLLSADERKVLVAAYPWVQDAGAYRHDPDAAPAILLIDTDDGAEQLLEQISLRGARVLVDAEDRPRFASGRNETDGAAIMWRPQPGAAWVSFGLTDFAAKDFAPQKLAPDARSAFVLGRQTRDTRRALHRVNLQTQAAEKVYEHAEVDVESVIEDLAGEKVIGLRIETDRPEYHWLEDDHPTAKLYQMMQRAFPGQTVDITSVTADLKQAVAHVQSDVNPGDYYLVDTQTRHAQYLRSARSWVDPTAMRPKESVLLKARDGLLLHGYLTRPRDGNGPFPTIVLPRAVPYGEREHWRYDWEAQLFAHYGYAVLQINYRGSGGYGDYFMRAGYREWGGKMQNDLTDGTLWAIEHAVAEKGNICIFGSAYGGYAATMAPVREPGLYKCVAGYNGLYDLEFVHASADPRVMPGARAYLDEILGTDVQELRGRSPVYYTERIDAAVLLLAGEGNATEADHAGRMWTAMSGAGKTAEAGVLASTTEVYARLLGFFAKQLRGGRAPASAPAPAAAPEPAPPPTEQPR